MDATWLGVGALLTRGVAVAALAIGGGGCDGDGGLGVGQRTDAMLADADADAPDTDAPRADVSLADATAEDVSADASPPAECAGEAITETAAGHTWTLRTFDPRCADPLITNCTLDGACLKEQKDNLVIVPAQVTRPELWVHLPGTGGKPTNAKNILRAAAFAGYRALGLAYLNEVTVSDRCTDPATGADYDEACPEETRLEIIYGADTSPRIAVGRHDGLVSRLEHALAWMDAQEPTRGWDAYLDADGHPRWDRIGLSGFSQGGGHVGLIARDKRLARAVFLSVAGDSTKILTGACAADGSCAGGGRCCDVSGEPQCDSPPASGGQCVDAGLAPWVESGRGGAGAAASRATPAARLYGLVNVSEPAWVQTPLVFNAWGLNAWGGFISADPSDGAPPFSGTHQLSSALPPCGSGSAHQSMGADAIEPKIGGCGGVKPAMFDAWVYMMTHEQPE